MDWREARLGGRVNPGWEPLVDELHRRVTKVCPTIVVDQVKEKFGGLRYYFDVPDDVRDVEVTSEDGWVYGTVYDLVQRYVEQAETVSFWICEVCGKPGHLYGKSWVNTLCAEHGEIHEGPGTPPAWEIAEKGL